MIGDDVSICGRDGISILVLVVRWYPQCLFPCWAFDESERSWEAEGKLGSDMGDSCESVLEG
jgi:hypothetical protein